MATIFLQTPETNVQRKENCLPASLRRLFKAAKKHAVTLELLRFSKMRLETPAWYSTRFDSVRAKCLKSNHDNQDETAF
ncbi:hypothetical protein E4T56_gene4615 [Termitomyces sp. T112]|nr:hypothetical protein E4T56_gene4615 [Termitomyces sp. T112]